MTSRTFTPDIASHPTKSKRAWAAVLDIFFTIIPTVVFFILFYTLTIDLFDTRSMFDEVAQDQLKTGLYVEVEGQKYPTFINTDKNDLTYDSEQERAESYFDAVEKYREACVYYYKTYKTEISPDRDELVTLDGGGGMSRQSYYTNHWINVNVLGISEVYEDGKFSSDFYVTDNLDKDPLEVEYNFSSENEVGSEQYYSDKSLFLAKLSSFYYGQTGTTGSYAVALDDYASESHVKDWDSVTATHTMIYFWISLIPSAGVFWFIIPIFSPYGQTLGKRIFKIFVVTRDDEELPRTRIGYRCLFEWVLISISFGFTLGLLSIIDTIIMACTRNQRTITDSLLITSVTDDIIA